jgi:hypothetical protein
VFDAGEVTMFMSSLIQLLKTPVNYEYHPVNDKERGVIRRLLLQSQKKIHADGTRMNGTIKIYRFRQYDIGADEFKLSSRMATLACIRRIHAELIRSSEREIEKRFLDADGMTDIISDDRLPGKPTSARRAPCDDASCLPLRQPRPAA